MEFHKKCLLCKHEGLQPLAGYYDRHGLVKCTNCGFVMMNRMATKEVLDAHYCQYNYASEGFLSPLTIKSYNVLLDELEGYRRTNRLLDVGCGRGWFLLEAKKRGWEVFGSEYSAKAVEIGLSNGIPMVNGPLLKTSFESNFFDVITSFEVLEHIDNPQEEMALFHQILRTGGLFYCTTPNFNSAMRYYLKADYNVIEFPEHLGYFTRRTLIDLAVHSGFRKNKVLTTGISLTRLRSSINSTNEAYVAQDTPDEKLRESLDRRPWLRTVKNTVNTLLTWTRLGMTLKGYFIKN